MPINSKVDVYWLYRLNKHKRVFRSRGKGHLNVAFHYSFLYDIYISICIWLVRWIMVGLIWNGLNKSDASFEFIEYHLLRLCVDKSNLFWFILMNHLRLACERICVMYGLKTCWMPLVKDSTCILWWIRDLVSWVLAGVTLWAGYWPGLLWELGNRPGWSWELSTGRNDSGSWTTAGVVVFGSPYCEGNLVEYDDNHEDWTCFWWQCFGFII